jgi:hypothetical protein
MDKPFRKESQAERELRGCGKRTAGLREENCGAAGRELRGCGKRTAGLWKGPWLGS